MPYNNNGEKEPRTGQFPPGYLERANDLSIAHHTARALEALILSSGTDISQSEADSALSPDVRQLAEEMFKPVIVPFVDPNKARQSVDEAFGKVA